MSRLRAAGKRGFTLAEFLLTLLLFTSAIFPLLSAVSTSLLVSTELESGTTALYLAQAKMEEAMNISYGALASSAKAPIPNFPDYQAERQVTTPLTGLKDVKVTVYWQTSPSTTPQAKRATGSVQMITLETYVID